MQLRGGTFSADFLEHFAVSFMHDAEMGKAHHENTHMLINQT